MIGMTMNRRLAFALPLLAAIVVSACSKKDAPADAAAAGGQGAAGYGAAGQDGQQGYGSPQGYGAPQAYGAPQTYGGPPVGGQGMDPNMGQGMNQGMNQGMGQGMGQTAGPSDGGQGGYGGAVQGGQPSPQALMQLEAWEKRDMQVAPQSTLHAGAAHGPTPTQIPGGKTITTRELVGMLSSGQRVVILETLGAPQLIPNAFRAVPAAAPGDFNDATQQQFTKILQQLTQNRTGTPIVTYFAAPECWMSYNAALRAIKAGYTNVNWYRGGLEAWQKAGGPVMSDQQPGPPGPQQQGQYPPQQGQYPPQQGQQYPPQQGQQYPPQQGQYPPQQGGDYPPQQGQYPQQGGQYPPQGQYPQQGGQYPQQYPQQ